MHANRMLRWIYKIRAAKLKADKTEQKKASIEQLIGAKMLSECIQTVESKCPSLDVSIQIDMSNRSVM